MSSEITSTDAFVDTLTTKLGDFLWEEIIEGEDFTSVNLNGIDCDWSHTVAKELSRKFVKEMADDIQKYKEQLLDDYEEDSLDTLYMMDDGYAMHTDYYY